MMTENDAGGAAPVVAVTAAERAPHERETAVQLRQLVLEWEGWYEGLVADFAGLTTDNDPGNLHDWAWMDTYRPAPSFMQREGCA